MRSDKSARLSGHREQARLDHEAPTLKLIQEWNACLRSLERDDAATPLTAPFWCIGRLCGVVSRRALEQQDRRLWSAISAKYTTVFAEHMVARSVPTEAAQKQIRQILANAFTALRAPQESYWIPMVLWREASAVLGDHPAIKPKYLLRALVDEISDGPARKAVEFFAYQVGERPRGTSRVHRESFDAGCVALHQVLHQRASSLKLWTDGSVSAKVVFHTASDPIPYMEHLLLRV
jgi:hypothetical protein